VTISMAELHLYSLAVSVTKTATGVRTSGVVAPKVWHDSPDSKRSSDSITSFKKNLKTYLFNQAFTS